MDVALSEIYFNDAFDWTLGPGGDDAKPAIDVETAALHEIGHALSLGHFGPPPAAVMNPVYDGPRRVPRADRPRRVVHRVGVRQVSRRI